MKNSSSFHFFIITPSYNQGHFIRQTIDSVLTQSNVGLKLFVFDASSTDQTVPHLKSYRHTVAWVSEADKGQTDAINKGLTAIGQEMVKSRLTAENVVVAYLNSDDYYLPEALTKVAGSFSAHPEAGWLVGDCQIVNEDNKRIQPFVKWYKQFLRSLGWWTMTITNPIPQPATFIRWSAVQKVGSFNESLRYVMDYEYWWRLRKKVGMPVYLDQELAAFRIHGQSKGSSQFDKQFAEELEVAKKNITNPVLIFLHQLHTLIITTLYTYLK